MGFQKPDIARARSILSRAVTEIESPYNDGWTSSTVKHELYELKCWLDDRYNSLPTFTGEEQWEQDRVIQILKK